MKDFDPSVLFIMNINEYITIFRIKSIFDF